MVVRGLIGRLRKPIAWGRELLASTLEVERRRTFRLRLKDTVPT